MDRPIRSQLAASITRAARRLFLQTLINRLAWCLIVALGLAAIWFLAEPLLVEAKLPWLRWVVAGSLIGLGSILGVVLAMLAAPPKLATVLLLDERFGLKERVTTAWSLTPEQEATPAGQALLTDVEQKVQNLDVGSRFPIQLGWVASLVPLAALLLGLIAAFYDPPASIAKAKVDPLNQPAANAAEIAEKMKELKKKAVEPRDVNRPKSEELQKIEAELEKIANKPAETPRELRDRIKEMTSLEERIKERQQQVGERSQKIQDQLKQLDRMNQQQAGPASDLQKALAEGKMDKAKEEMDKLAKKLENKALTKEQKDQLAKQLENLQDKLQKLAQQDEQKQQLEQLAKEGKISKETLERELERLNRDGDKLKDLQDLAQKLGQCKECLNKGDNKEAMAKLADAAQKLDQLKLSDQEMKDLQDQLQKLQDAKSACAKGDKPGEGEGEGQGGGKDGKDGKDGLARQDGGGGKGNGKGDTNQPNQGGIGAGRRPDGKAGNTNSFDAQQKAHFDNKGKKIFAGHAPGENFKSKTSPELAGDIKQASQDAPEAIEHQQIPKAARDMAKEYFRNLGNQQK